MKLNNKDSTTSAKASSKSKILLKFSQIFKENRTSSTNDIHVSLLLAMSKSLIEWYYFENFSEAMNKQTSYESYIRCSMGPMGQFSNGSLSSRFSHLLDFSSINAELEESVSEHGKPSKLNPLNANPEKWSNTLKQDDLFECV